MLLVSLNVRKTENSAGWTTYGTFLVVVLDTVPNHCPRRLGHCLIVFKGDAAIDDHHLDSGGLAPGFFKARAVVNAARIEDRQVGERAGPNHAAIF